MSEMHRIKLVVGDYSCDGHGRSEDFYILSNLAHKELTSAFYKGEEIIGISFYDQLSEYDTRHLDQHTIDKMAMYFDVYGIDADYWIQPHEYVDYWLQIAKVGNPDLKFDYDDGSEPIIEIGGYGLFE
jgi:hypothetical protein